MPDGQIVSVRHADLVERHIEVVALSGTFSNVVKIRLAQVRPKLATLVPMDREVQHSAMVSERVILKSCKLKPFLDSPRIIVEHPLRSLPMVDVPVYDQNLLQPQLIQGMLSSNGNIVEKAIPIVFGLHCMMARWPDNCHPILHLPGHDCIDQLDCTPTRQQ